MCVGGGGSWAIWRGNFPCASPLPPLRWNPALINHWRNFVMSRLTRKRDFNCCLHLTVLSYYSISTLFGTHNNCCLNHQGGSRRAWQCHGLLNRLSSCYQPLRVQIIWHQKFQYYSINITKSPLEWKKKCRNFRDNIVLGIVPWLSFQVHLSGYRSSADQSLYALPLWGAVPASPPQARGEHSLHLCGPVSWRGEREIRLSSIFHGVLCNYVQVASVSWRGSGQSCEAGAGGCGDCTFHETRLPPTKGQTWRCVYKLHARLTVTTKSPLHINFYNVARNLRSLLYS